MPEKPRHVAGIFLPVFFAFTIPAAAGDADLAKAEGLLAQGRFAKAAHAFERNLQDAEGGCAACALGLVRSYTALGRFDEAGQAVRALTDLARDPGSQEVGSELLQELTATFREALERGEHQALLPLLDLLATQGRSEEAARLVAAQLAGAGEEERALLCAADLRLSPSTAFGFAEELNGHLTTLGWEGPWLLTPEMKPPQKKTRGYITGRKKGVLLAGVVNKKGRIVGLRQVRPSTGKLAEQAEKDVRATFFDPATLRGRRIEVCFPILVSTSKEVAVELPGTSGLFAGLKTVEAVVAQIDTMELVKADILKRADLCGIELPESDYAALNQELTEREWQGPFFIAGDVAAPAAVKTPEPPYTEEAKKAGLEGQVVLNAAIDQTGRMHVLGVFEEMEGGLTEEAVKTVGTWTFEPALFGGKAVPVCKRVTIDFKRP